MALSLSESERAIKKEGAEGIEKELDRFYSKEEAAEAKLRKKYWPLRNHLKAYIRENKGKIIFRQLEMKEIKLSERCDKNVTTDRRYEDQIQKMPITYWHWLMDKQAEEFYYQGSRLGSDTDWGWDHFVWNFEWDENHEYSQTFAFSLESDLGTGTAHAGQIYSLKLTPNGSGKEGMFPLEVYGLIHVYSKSGRRYQVIFNQDRSNCQTLTEEDPCLLLKGPALPPVAFSDLRIQGTLKLKSTTQSEEDDKFLIVSTRKRKLITEESEEDDPIPMGYVQGEQLSECPTQEETRSKHYSLEMTCGIVIFSFVATISVRIEQGVLPPDCCFIASTASFPEMELVLLRARDDKVLLEGHMVKLSRRTICVEFCGKLNFIIKRGDILIKMLEFPTEHHNVRHPTVSTASYDINSCTIEVKVTWRDYFDCY